MIIVHTKEGKLAFDPDSIVAVGNVHNKRDTSWGRDKHVDWRFRLDYGKQITTLYFDTEQLADIAWSQCAGKWV